MVFTSLSFETLDTSIIGVNTTYSQVPDNKKSSYFQVGVPPELLDLTLSKTEVGQFSKTTLSRHTRTVESHMKSVQHIVCKCHRICSKEQEKVVHSMAVSCKTIVFRRACG